ncbi:universal stress protein [Spiribacter halobius]|uniref:Universal stress protein n=1 Tax=Sediminicurvatus halobius TaxID=2182432 RepID=A0A2U2N110_9GAMM|nr:universal stress protein [Spiribacter halobius]PWG62921.1 universal stress protein [Spiribacter halobius]UEX77432.1 universal stress protein [Spiribacter halobius]
MLKDVLVYLEEGHNTNERIGVAAELAERFSAHLTGIAVSEPMAARAEFLPPEALEGYRRSWQVRNARLGEAFRAETDRRGLSAEWRAVEDMRLDLSVADILARHARYADLLVVGQYDPDEPHGLVPDDLAGHLAVLAGRPVLAVPYAWQPVPVGRRVVIAWNAGREAARAVADALPLLREAEVVHLAVVEGHDRRRGDHGELPGADIATHLARHGVAVEADRLVMRDVPVADALLSLTAEQGADLLVMGAYGRPRLRELVMGGTTRGVLEQMTVPVLMAH